MRGDDTYTSCAGRGSFWSGMKQTNDRDFGQEGVEKYFDGPQTTE